MVMKMTGVDVNALKKDVEEVNPMKSDEVEKIINIIDGFNYNYEAHVGACCELHPLLIILLKDCESFNDWKHRVKNIKNMIRENGLEELTGKVLIDCENGLTLK